MNNLKELEKKYEELGREIEALKNKDKFEYPIYAKIKNTSVVVKFTDLQTGEVVVQGDIYDIGETSTGFTPHTDTNLWEILPVCPRTGFFDGQLVWCWDNEDTHYKVLHFYDAKKNKTFSYEGIRNSIIYDNYKAFEGNYPDWAIEAFKTLER